MNRLEQWWRERCHELEKLEATDEDAKWSVSLSFRQSSDAEFAHRARDAAKRCPRCVKCGHHPHAHEKTGCQVIQEIGSSKRKCGCASTDFRSAA